MSGAWSGGKGDQRRKEDAKKIAENWDKIFGKKQDKFDNEISDLDEDYIKGYKLAKGENTNGTDR